MVLRLLKKPDERSPTRTLHQVGVRHPKERSPEVMAELFHKLPITLVAFWLQSSWRDAEPDVRLGKVLVAEL